MAEIPDEAYGLILFDCPPAIGYQSMNAVFTTDMLLVPSGPAYWEYNSTTSFLGQLADALEDQNAGFGQTFPARKVSLPKAFTSIRFLNSVYEIDYRDMTRGTWRRGPMATAIAETSVAVGERQAEEAAIRAENDALAAAHARANRMGLVVEMIPLDQILSTKLMRDRTMRGVETDLQELKDSLLAVGLSNPIRVERAGEGEYELIQGLRRLTAYRALYEETGDEVWAIIPASLTQAGETTEALYRRMVDENLVCKDVSFAEMALLARAYMEDPETGCVDIAHAVKVLYGSASYQKRFHIRSFAELMDRFDKYLEHPEAISRNLGIALRQRMAEIEGFSGALQKALRAIGPGQSEGAELALLRRFSAGDIGVDDTASPRGAKSAPKGETRFVFKRPTGEARCKAVQGGDQGPRRFQQLQPGGPEARGAGVL